jgi:hypothetical protein
MKNILLLLIALSAGACVKKDTPKTREYSGTEIRLLFAADVMKECGEAGGSSRFCECSSIQLATNESAGRQTEYINARRMGDQAGVDKAMDVELAKRIAQWCGQMIDKGEDFYVYQKFD